MKNTALSKSRYTKYCHCPKALWLSVNKPDEATVDPAVEVRFAEGNVVGDLAMDFSATLSRLRHILPTAGLTWVQ